MNSKVLTGVIVAVVIIVGTFFVFKSSSSNQPSTTQTTVPTPTTTTTSEPSMSEMPMNSQSPSEQPSSQPVSSTSVTIQNFAFSPSTITVKVGDKVTWTNQDSIQHSATADDNSWDTGLLSQGKSGSVTFSKPGTFTYHCSIHPNMHGTVIVQ